MSTTLNLLVFLLFFGMTFAAGLFTGAMVVLEAVKKDDDPEADTAHPKGDPS